MSLLYQIPISHAFAEYCSPGSVLLFVKSPQDEGCLTQHVTFPIEGEVFLQLPYPLAETKSLQIHTGAKNIKIMMAHLFYQNFTIRQVAIVNISIILLTFTSPIGETNLSFTASALLCSVPNLTVNITTQIVAKRNYLILITKH